MNFSKIRTTIPLPNLIAVQRSSYEQFLQMDLLPEERDNKGLQAVFSSVFPFSDFRSSCELHFVRYELGTWECKCGGLKGLERLRIACEHCGTRIKAAETHETTVVCPSCGQGDAERGAALPDLRQPGRPAPHLHRERLPGTGSHVRGAAQGDVPPRALRAGRGRRATDAGRQGGGALLR